MSWYIMFDLRTFLALCLMIIEISLDLFSSNWILSLLLTNYSQSFLVSVKFFFRFWERLYIGKQDMNPEHIKEKSVSLLVVYRRLIARTNVLLQWNFLEVNKKCFQTANIYFQNPGNNKLGSNWCKPLNGAMWASDCF